MINWIKKAWKKILLVLVSIAGGFMIFFVVNRNAAKNKPTTKKEMNEIKKRAKEWLERNKKYSS